MPVRWSPSFEAYRAVWQQEAIAERRYHPTLPALLLSRCRYGTPCRCQHPTSTQNNPVFYPGSQLSSGHAVGLSWIQFFWAKELNEKRFASLLCRFFLLSQSSQTQQCGHDQCNCKRTAVALAIYVRPDVDARCCVGSLYEVLV